MRYVANQRIKKGGKFYAPGDPIELREADLERLPVKAVSPIEKLPEQEPSFALDEAQMSELKNAVAALGAEDFRQDGDIRAGALRTLNAELGTTLTVEDVAAFRAQQEQPPEEHNT